MSKEVFAFLFVAIAFVAISFVECQSADDSGKEHCPPNQIWSLCGTICEPTCETPNPNPNLCPRIECSKFTSRCRCEKGYYRKGKSCVSLNDC